MGILGGFTMIIDNVYVFTPDKAFVKGGIILDGDKIRQVYEERMRRSLAGTLWTEKAATPFRD